MQSTRAAIFCDSFGNREKYGAARYCWSLLSALKEQRASWDFVPISVKSELDDAKEASLGRTIGYKRIKLPRRAFALASTFARIPKAEWWTGKLDLMHWAELVYTVPTSAPLVVTCHDLGPLTHPQFYSKAHPWVMRSAVDYAMRHAAAVICVSQETADALSIVSKGQFDSRITVILEGVDTEVFRAEQDLPMALRSRPYFVCAGTISPRKNLLNVLSAFERIAASNPELRLKLVGGMGWDSEQVRKRMANGPASGQLDWLGFVTDSELANLLGGARALIYLSLMEGFGLPILEAMACGCPVITSSLSSMPEVAGDAAVLVDPTDLNAIAEAMNAITRNDVYADELRRRGLLRAGEFTWEKTARSTLEIYDGVSRSGRWGR